ncbi:TPA: SPFH domain-containing protein [Providencia alcalifaciens]
MEYHPFVYLAFGIVFIFIFFWLCTCIVITKQKTVKIIEQFGRYVSTKEAGISLKLPAPFQLVAKTLDTNILSLKERLELKTKDNLFISYPVALQIQILDPVKACYELENPNQQILSFVGSFIRSEAGKHNFMDLYGLKNELEDEIITHLGAKMAEFGWQIKAVLVDEPIPSEAVRKSYDSVSESQRNLEAAKNQAEAQKVTLIAEAEAQKEAKRLYGEGIAAQRDAIATGFSESISKLAQSMGTTNELAAAFLLQTTKFDTIRESATKGSLIITDVQSDFELKNTLNLKNTFKDFMEKQA